MFNAKAICIKPRNEISLVCSNLRYVANFIPARVAKPSWVRFSSKRRALTLVASCVATSLGLLLIKDNILIVGFGNVGFSCLLYLLKNGYRNISILIRNIKDFQKKGIETLNTLFDVNIKVVSEFDKYNTYIEATGDSNVIKNIVETTENNSTVILLGTPREESYLFSPLQVHRKNLKIFGGHELNGHTIEERDLLYKELLNENKKYKFNEFVNIYKSSNNILNEILENKRNFIEVIQYDI